jgi:RsiW-degrading membrane proteinase PrsW (M82 family)
MAVYAAFVSLGFAFFENIEYLIQYGVSGQFVRYFTAVPMHLCTGIFMGIYLGDAALAQRKNIREARWDKFFALVIPILLHGFYDYTIMAGFNAAWIISFICIIALSIIVVNYKRNHDVKIKYPNNVCPKCGERIVGVYCIKCGKKLF